MNNSNLIYKGNLVHEWSQENVRIRIFDDEYATKAPDEIKKSIKEIENIALQITHDKNKNNMI